MDKLNEFDDMLLATAYMGDKFVKYLKKKKVKQRMIKRMQQAKNATVKGGKYVAKKLVKKENVNLDVYLDYVQESEQLDEGFFSNLNCKRHHLGYRMNMRDFYNPAKAALKEECEPLKKVNPYKYSACKEHYTRIIKVTEQALEKIKANIKKDCPSDQQKLSI